ncbi:ATP-binding protein [Streptomyces sp. NBC_01571]|uniref:AAA family ATPase n=1 Tax=Streptomyces sp. NBC_01571 TaxID=2975883 RepID=UPI002251797E|nr:AAA family ATPase [Streptomyces sp. NBC_01571]MCX4576536.1 ATP-binding protein [Streptomyces sp. NBC_01571]
MLIVVTGPPAAGKSSWIKDHAKANDIVIDLDLMALAMAGPGADHHAHGDVLMRVVHRARFAALNEAYQHLDKVDVYVIHTQPSAKALAKYKRLEARIVTIDPGREIVMQRVKAMRQPEMERVVTRWYNARRGRPRDEMPQASRVW